MIRNFLLILTEATNRLQPVYLKMLCARFNSTPTQLLQDSTPKSVYSICCACMYSVCVNSQTEVTAQ